VRSNERGFGRDFLYMNKLDSKLPDLNVPGKPKFVEPSCSSEKAVSVVGFANFSSHYQSQGVGAACAAVEGAADVFHLDTCASIHVVGSDGLLGRMTNVQAAGEHDVVMMNAFPAPVSFYGDLAGELECLESGERHHVLLEHCAVVPSSEYNLISISQHLKKISAATGRRKVCAKYFLDKAKLPLESRSVTAGKRDGLYRINFHVEAPARRASAMITSGGEQRRAGGDEGAKLPVAGDADSTSMSHERGWGEVVLARARAVFFRLHKSYGHGASLDSVQKWVRSGRVSVNDALVRKALLGFTAKDVVCRACTTASITKKAPSKTKSSQRPGRYWLDLSTNLPRNRQGHTVVAVFVYPGRRGVHLVSTPGKSAEHLRTMMEENVKRMEKDCGVPMKELASDGESAITSKLVSDFLRKEGISQFVNPGKSGNAAEAHIRWSQDRARAMLQDSGLPKRYFIDAMMKASADADKLPSGKDGGSRYERRTGLRPDLSKSVPFGAEAVAHIPDLQRKKPDNRGRIVRVLRERSDGPGYLVLDQNKRSVFRSNDLRLLPTIAEEHDEPASRPLGGKTGAQDAKGAASVRVEHACEGGAAAEMSGGGDGGRPKRIRGKPHRYEADSYDVAREVERKCKPSAQVTSTTSEGQQCERPERVSGDDGVQRQGEQSASAQAAGTSYTEAREHAENLLTGPIPKTKEEAFARPDGEFFRAAVAVEEENIRKSGTLQPVMLAPAEFIGGRRFGRKLRGRTVIGSRYVFAIQLLSPDDERTGPTIRIDQKGQKLRYKARLVALGYQQRPSDYSETYAATPQIAAVRMAIALSLMLNWGASQLDVRAAFVQAHLPEDEQVYMTLPGRAGLVYRLMRSLYGLKQAAYRWSEDVSKTLQKEGFEAIDGDTCLYTHRDEDGKIVCVIVLHVDDCLLIAEDGVREAMEEKLMCNYEMTKSAARWFLKMKIGYAADGSSVTLSQPEYAEAILEHAKLEGCKPVTTPMRKLPTEPQAPITEEEADFMRDKDYGGLVGMLSHYTTQTRPDLALSVAQLQRFTKDPRPQHWKAAERVVRYIAGTKNYGLRFTKDGFKEIVGYSDSDWAGRVDDRKSTSGYVFSFMGAAIAWKSKKQPSVARSTAEAELIALDLAVREARWLRKMCYGLDVNLTDDGKAPCLTVFEDNEACLNIAKGSRWSNETKHVDVKFFAVKEDVKENRVRMKQIATKDNLADMFTKPLGRVKFENFRTALGCVPVD
jgi:RNA:NAD 2'-phosphotransferase (TPT1/KptA family)